MEIEFAITAALDKNKTFIKNRLAEASEYTWDNFIWPIERMEAELSDLFATVSHLDSVANTPEIHAIYQKVLPLITLYHTEMSQDKKLYQAYKSVKESLAYGQYNEAQKKAVDNPLRDFKLSGIELPDDQKEILKKLNVELSELESQFEQHVLESTNAWGLEITDINELKGLPAEALASAAEKAKAKGKTGWVLTLDYPSYHAVMTSLENSAIRRTVYEAYSTRASNLFPGGSQWDNSPLIDKIIEHRQHIATILKFNSYAALALENRMLKTPAVVIDFLSQLLEKALVVAKKEMIELQAFAKEHYQLATVNVWDVAFLSEKMCQKQYSISENLLRQYFPESVALSGLFNIAHQLYGIKITETKATDLWDPSVRLFEIVDSDNQLRGKFYLDLYARSSKRGGAWVANAKLKMKEKNDVQSPEIYLNMNVAKPIQGKEALLSHEEVLTLFHEFGHTLHGLLTQIGYPSISGLEGVAWDGVELPSQLMENWCWEQEALKLITRHVETKEALPAEIFSNLIASKNFQAGLHLVRQLEFALFDFNIHLNRSENKEDFVQETLDDIRTKTALLPVPAFNRFQHSFTHVFSGGYSAGYYSYLWSEVLSADSYEFFKHRAQVFDKSVAKSFLENILEKGGSRDFMDLFIAFRGKEPDVSALLRQYNLI
jgi:oligopeptidase A